MLTYQRFTGINNVVPAERLLHNPKTATAPLVEATNVDIGLALEARRRQGFTIEAATFHKNVHQAKGFRLATLANGNLVAIDDAGVETVLYPSLGLTRVWYGNWPDGRTTFSNGLIQGIASASAATAWGVPLPAGIGAATDVAGSLKPGKYRYSLTHVRTADGLEGGPVYCGEPVTIADGGIVLDGLPQLAGHSLNVYLTSHNDDTAYYAGNTSGTMFAFTGANDELVLRCKTDWLQPPPVGTLSAFWRGRALLAVGNVLHASEQDRWELFDLGGKVEKIKQFRDDITLVQPVQGGIFVGTTTELAFLEGVNWDSLAYRDRIAGRVVLGSGVTVPGKQLKRGDSIAGAGDCMLCICDGVLTAGYQDGAVAALTEGVYETDATEVAATFRMRERIPQYIAIAQ